MTQSNLNELLLFPADALSDLNFKILASKRGLTEIIFASAEDEELHLCLAAFGENSCEQTDVNIEKLDEKSQGRSIFYFAPKIAIEESRTLILSATPISDSKAL